MPRRSLLVLLLLALVTGACGSDDPDAGGGADGLGLLTGGTWEYVEGRTPSGPLVAPDGARITLLVEDDGTYGGTAACNGYGGTLQVDGTRVVFGDAAITEMACDPPALMQAEQQFMEGLLAVAEAARTDDRLVLTGPDTELRFALQPPVKDAAIVGTVWELDTLLAGDAATSVMGDPATIEFTEDGMVTFGSGCRTFSGEYEVSGDEIVLPRMGADDASVECPEQLRAQDSHVVSVLEGPFRASVDGQRLTLLRADGDGLGYRAR